MVPEPDPPSNVVPLAVPAADLARAERARRNGARSRGPVTATGKARSARNALKHGLTAQHGVVLDGEDAPAFMAMAERLLADLAPTGELAAFLAADLAAAIWRTGRARRLERQAFAGDVPDPDQLNLALRYGGSASRELHRALRALERLGRRPAPTRAEEPRAEEPRTEEPQTEGPQTDDVPPVAALAWGAGGPPPPPPGCLLLRPVPGHWASSWWRHQAHAFPGAEPVAVADDGTIHALRHGAWVVQPPHVPPGAEPPDGPLARWRDELVPAPPPPRPAPAAGLTPRHGMTAADLGDASPSPAMPDESQRRNEPSQPVEPQGFTSAPAPSAPPPMAPDAWSRLWGLAPAAEPGGTGETAADPTPCVEAPPGEVGVPGRRRRIRRRRCRDRGSPAAPAHPRNCRPEDG